MVLRSARILGDRFFNFFFLIVIDHVWWPSFFVVFRVWLFFDVVGVGIAFGSSSLWEGWFVGRLLVWSSLGVMGWEWLDLATTFPVTPLRLPFPATTSGFPSFLCLLALLAVEEFLLLSQQGVERHWYEKMKKWKKNEKNEKKKKKMDKMEKGKQWKYEKKMEKGKQWKYEKNGKME